MRGKFSPKALAVAAVATAAILAGTGTASAAVGGDYTTNGVKLRSGPSQDYAIYGVGYVGNGETDWCYTVGQTIYGNVFWDWNTNNVSGANGYSSEYYLTSGSSQFTHC